MNTQEKDLQEEMHVTAKVFTGQLPDLSKAEAAPLPINGDYWTPVKAGDIRRMFFLDIRIEVMIDRQTGEDVELPVVYFVEEIDGRKTIVRQGGCRLTSVFESGVKAGSIKPGMAFEVQYTGKQRTTSGNSVDTWIITPLATA